VNSIGDEIMKKIIVLAVVAVALASATAYAQMQPHQSQAQSSGEGMMHGPMHGQMQKHMQGKMHGGQSGSQAGHGADQTASEHTVTGPQGDRGPSSLAFHGINQKMHEGMNITFTGNADVDFVNGMIPHHQGAVDMAKVVLAFGNDPEIRKLAEAVIRAQEGEIALMRAWLQRNVR
jgi:opacity protein-like surface antigen